MYDPHSGKQTRFHRTDPTGKFKHLDVECEKKWHSDPIFIWCAAMAFTVATMPWWV